MCLNPPTILANTFDKIHRANFSWRLYLQISCPSMLCGAMDCAKADGDAPFARVLPSLPCTVAVLQPPARNLSRPSSPIETFILLALIPFAWPSSACAVVMPDSFLSTSWRSGLGHGPTWQLWALPPSPRPCLCGLHDFFSPIIIGCERRLNSNFDRRIPH